MVIYEKHKKWKYSMLLSNKLNSFLVFIGLNKWNANNLPHIFYWTKIILTKVMLSLEWWIFECIFSEKYFFYHHKHPLLCHCAYVVVKIIRWRICRIKENRMFLSRDIIVVFKTWLPIGELKPIMCEDQTFFIRNKLYNISIIFLIFFTYIYIYIYPQKTSHIISLFQNFGLFVEYLTRPPFSLTNKCK